MNPLPFRCPLPLRRRQYQCRGLSLTLCACVALLLIAAGAITWAQSIRLPDHADVVFARTPQRELTLDMYIPAGASHPPLLVYIHGGGWKGGNPKKVPFLPLLEEGYALASIRYRFSQEAPFPAQIEDVKAALAWLREHAESYGVDASRIGVIGGSAGAHLAMLVGVTADEKTGPLRAVVSYFGPADFLLRAQTQPKSTNAAGSTVFDLLGGTPAEKEDLARQASPAFHVEPHAPPLLLFHGTKDWVVLLDQSQRMVEAYKEAGRPAMLHVKQGAGHKIEDFLDEKHYKLLIDFLQEHLPPSSSPHPSSR